VKTSLLCFAIAILLVASALSQEASGTAASSSNQAPQPATAVDSDVSLGKPLEWDSPKYPTHARKSKLQGSVVLKLSVDKDGKVNGVETVSGTLN
jgi:outer membrane biosynthesis protein TonB